MGAKAFPKKKKNAGGNSGTGILAMSKVLEESETEQELLESMYGAFGGEVPQPQANLGD